MWQEITEEALPKFNNINDAPDLWLWEVVKKNLDDYEVSYDEIEQKAKEIFGEEFTKQFPKEGTEYIQYNEKLKKYVATGVGLDTLDDSFFIKQITKTKNGYEVEIAEYLEDYENSMNIEDENQVYDIYIKDLNHNIIATIKSNDGETKSIEVVKENIDKNIVFEVKNTICNATSIRQKETQEIAKQVDLMIIIGGKHSSNTTKLYEIAKKECKNCILIETSEELNKNRLKNISKIGIMAGASTPSESINNTVEKLKEIC